MQMEQERTGIIDCITGNRSFYLVSHMQPDGDSVGSLLAMGEGLSSLGKKVTMFSPWKIPRMYSFLKGVELVTGDVRIEDPTAPVIVLDSSDPERLGTYRDEIMKGETIINIDHHVTNQYFGTLNLVDPDAAATGEIIYFILRDLGVSLNKSIAEALYVAISTDTGSFKYDNTTPITHRVVASLLEYGLSPGSLSQRMFDERPLSFYLLLKEAISSLEMHAGQKIALMTLSRDLRIRNGATTDELEGIVNYPRNIEGVEIGILIYADKEKEVKVGFRSKSVDVSVLAGRLNGGGHARAAGCRIHEGYEEARKMVIKAALDMIEESGV